MSEPQPIATPRLIRDNDPEIAGATLGHLTRAMCLVIGTTPEAHRFFTAMLKVASVAAETGDRAAQVQRQIEQITKQLTGYLATLPSSGSIR